jgi:hypothetical protein
MAQVLARVQAESGTTEPGAPDFKTNAMEYVECIDAANPENEPATMVSRRG